MYGLVDGKVIREDGLVAIQHRNSNPTAYKVDDTVYNWVARHNVSLAWVRPEHLNNVLSQQARICCGKQGKRFMLASLINTNIFETGVR